MSAEDHFRRLAAQAQPNGNHNPRKLGGGMAGPGGAHDRDGVVIDATDAVLVDTFQIATVDTYTGRRPGPPRIYMTLGGRVNKSKDRVQVGCFLPPDGAAAIITETLAVADRFGEELLEPLVDRFVQLQRAGHINLGHLLVCLGRAMELAGMDVDDPDVIA